MLTQLCPHCYKLVSIADDAVAQDALCLSCGKTFPVTVRYNPEVAPASPLASTPPTTVTAPQPPGPAAMSTVPPPAEVPAAPPGYVPPVVPPASAMSEPPLPATPAGYSKTRGLTFSPRVIGWLPAVCLTLTFITTLFGWVGAYVGGHPVYGQGPWRAMVGSVDRNFQLESLIPGGPSWLDKVRSDWELMVPYLLCLILAMLLAWVERGTSALDPNQIPPPLRPLLKLWPYKNLVIATLAILALMLVLTQVFNGFGLQRAAEAVVEEKFATQRKEAGGSAAALAKVEFDEEQEYSKFNLERTIYLYLGLGLHMLAVLAIVMDAGLDRRGNKPPPRLVLQY